MKGYLFSISAFFLSVLLIDESSCNQQASAAAGKRGFFPLAAGNYWIFRDSTFSEGKFVSVSNDTDKIVSVSDWNGKKTFIFQDGKEWYMSGDTVYQLSTQRTGFKFPSPALIASDKGGNFNYVFGGDVVVQKEVEKLVSCPQNQWKSISCYKISDSCNSYQIVGYGVGILHERISECFSGKNNYTTRTLIDLHLN